MTFIQFIAASRTVRYAHVTGNFHRGNTHVYRTDHRRSQTSRSGTRTGILLVVPLRPVQEPTLVRRLAQRLRVFPRRVDDHRETQLRDLPMQTLDQVTILRRHTQAIAGVVAAVLQHQ